MTGRFLLPEGLYPLNIGGRLAPSAYKDDRYVYGMLRAGAAGYLLKEEALETVVAAVRAVAQGEEWYSQQVMGKVMAWVRGEAAVWVRDHWPDGLPGDLQHDLGKSPG